jgi:hypothetical protein
MTTYRFIQAPFNSASWKAYLECADAREMLWKLEQSHWTPVHFCIYAVPEGFPPNPFAHFCAAVQVYRTDDANHFFLEHLITNPTMPLKVRHRAVELIIKCVRSYASATGKFAYLVTDVPSVARMLARRGFTHKPVQLMSASPEMALGALHEKAPPRTIPGGAPSSVSSTTDVAPKPKRRKKRAA